MCAIYGFLDYGKKIPHRVLSKLLKEISIVAECRGTDATGISYVKDNKIVTYKKAKPAHKVKLYFPKDTTALIGHNRMTTQGNEKYNFNNHPFEGKTGNGSFSLAHNGILHNDRDLQKIELLPKTHIETDSYVAVQLLEKCGSVCTNTLKEVSEKLRGTFVLTVLRDDSTLYLVKGDNPITLLHFPKIGLYLYASTTDILYKAMKSARFTEPFEKIDIDTGDIVKIDSNGNISKNHFHCDEGYSWRWYMGMNEERENELYIFAGYYGIDVDDIDLLLEFGYSYDEIEEMFSDRQLFETTMAELRAVCEEVTT